MRKSATEQILPQGGIPGTTPLKNQVVTYIYDNLNRLVAEVADDDPGAASNGYTVEYEYDLVGNRLSRAIWFDHRADELYTEYEYNEQDRLIREIHKDTIPSAMIEHSDGPYYAYAGSGGIFYGRDGSKTRIGQFKAWFMGLPSSVSHWLFGLVVAMLVVVFFVPALMQILARIRGRQPTRMPLSLSHRCLSVLIAYVMLISPVGFEQLAQASTQYSQLGTSSWGEAGDVFSYCYDANGSMVYKVYADVADIETMSPADVDTWLSNNTTVAYDKHIYNLQNRLARIEKYDSYQALTSYVEYKYNNEGIRVEKDDNGTVTTYLVDSYNHTGYAQVLEEDGPAGLKTYTIGDDILTQAVDSGPAEHLLYDGHGSTRQLVSGSVGSTNIIDDFSYDGYGVLLQDESSAQNNPGKTPAQATSLLYAGEHFDTDAQQYYLRARYYDPLNGRFNRLDPYAGSPQDPQSLHKYLYAHANPINYADPTGRSILFWVCVVGILSFLGLIAYMNFYNRQTEEFQATGVGDFGLTEDELVALVNNMQNGTSRIPEVVEDGPGNWDEWEAACELKGVVTIGIYGEGAADDAGLTEDQWNIVNDYFENRAWFTTHPGVYELFPSMTGATGYAMRQGQAEITRMNLVIAECREYAREQGFESKINLWDKLDPMVVYGYK